jgi:hypothetical protein
MHTADLCIYNIWLLLILLRFDYMFWLYVFFKFILFLKRPNVFGNQLKVPVFPRWHICFFNMLNALNEIPLNQNDIVSKFKCYNKNLKWTKTWIYFVSDWWKGIPELQLGLQGHHDRRHCHQGERRPLSRRQILQVGHQLYPSSRRQSGPLKVSSRWVNYGLRNIMGDRRLFSRGGQKFSRRVGEARTYFLQKKSKKHSIFKSPLVPPPPNSKLK